MTLDKKQKRDLYNDGYVIASGRIPGEQIHAAKREINRSLGQGIDPNRISEFESRSFCPDLLRSPIIWDLLRANQTRAAVEDLIGPGAIDPENIWPQMAIRFQGRPTTPACHIRISMACTPPPMGLNSDRSGATRCSLVYFSTMYCNRIAAISPRGQVLIITTKNISSKQDPNHY
jgi:hypothetical protein